MIKKSWYFVSPENRFQTKISCIRHLLEEVFPGSSSGKELVCQCKIYETRVQSLGQEEPLEEYMAIHSNILAWRIPWTEEPGGLQSTGSQRIEHD